MKLTNKELNDALAAMACVCGADRRDGAGNRLDSLPAARAYRIKQALTAAWDEVDAVREQLCRDHGRPSEDGSSYILEGPGRKAFTDAWSKLLDEGRELELPATLTPAEIDGGWYRTPEGKREKFDLSAEHRGLLTRLGIIGEPQEAA